MFEKASAQPQLSFFSPSNTQVKTGFRKMLPVLPALLLLAATYVSARLPDGRAHANIQPMPVMEPLKLTYNNVQHFKTGEALPSLDSVYYFNQLIDHNNPSLGTFSQRYWLSREYYEPGGPMVLFTPGESNADEFTGYLTNMSMTGLIAQQEHGVTIVLEHRFFGYSNPYPDLSVASLKYLTVQQGIDDLAYFAKTVKLPMPGGDRVSPDKAPWVLVGGSYSGALTRNKPDVFWAGYASSAVVESIVDFWQYYDVIRQSMPQNCSADVQAVVQHFDQVFNSGNQSAIYALKDTFGMADVEHLDDAVGALRNNLWDWQKLNPYSGQDAAFYQFCDALEVKNGKRAPAAGWGVDYAVKAWGSYFKNTYMHSLCGDYDAGSCFDTYGTPYIDTSVDQWSRSWQWMVCNEMGFLQDSAPAGTPTLVSRLIQPQNTEEASVPPFALTILLMSMLAFLQRYCARQFPEAFSSPPVPNVQKTNAAYQGWDVKSDRLFFANGKRDPWRDVTVSSDFHTVASTARQPIVMGNGFHTSDLLTDSGYVDPSIASLQKQGLAYMHTWLGEWKNRSHGGKQDAAAVVDVDAGRVPGRFVARSEWAS
ncbi:hypothetical protein EVG20_g5021 [Dentipellis fragilis]|uniref:Peptidase S28 n=1 Tax=Dentipellis fragilis TaxID=205917 RepID=A0A4Y9YV11_9AGAM|nr:hypothetical protein EVG20_g5021 [Dentipellis fragilis]